MERNGKTWQVITRDVVRQGNRLMFGERHEGVDGGCVTCCMCGLAGLLDGFRFSLERN